MKTKLIITAIAMCLPFLINVGVAQQLGTNLTVLISDEFSPSVRGEANHSNLVARKVQPQEGTVARREIIFFNKLSGEAILAHSTNDVCFFKGKFFTVKPAGPDRAVFINISQPFGTNLFSADHAKRFRLKTASDYVRLDSPHRKLIKLDSVLQSEKNTLSAMGTPLRSVQLEVQDGKMVLLFESHTGLKGKAVLDDQLNPVSMMLEP